MVERTGPTPPPWEHDEEFWKGWFSLDPAADGFQTRSGKRQIGS